LNKDMLIELINQFIDQYGNDWLYAEYTGNGEPLILVQDLKSKIEDMEELR